MVEYAGAQSSGKGTNDGDSVAVCALETSPPTGCL